VGLVSALENAKEIIPSFRAPFHINHGSDDYGVPLSGSQRLLKQSETPADEKELNVIADGYHGLLSQLDAEETMKHEIEWIEKVLNKKKR
ncbi:MAG: alpha-beta hydrolase superfamily lysophospholipase, partial [Bacillariaceae sp.]|jgi:alpha-beta hydrolase superfamily lysophospholipase